MKPFIAAALAAFFVAGAAFAQQPQSQMSPQADPRTASARIQALESVLNLREAEMRAAMQDSAERLKKAEADAEAKLATWAEWYADLKKQIEQAKTAKK